jgi:alcohol dehydrogenase
VVHKVSTEVPAEAAVLTTAVIANGIQWVRRLAGASIGDTVVIQGPGQQGLAATIAARESGASPIVVTGLSIDGQRLALAQEFGADHVIDVEREDVVGRIEEITRGRMADIVVDVTGSPKAVAKSLDLVRPMGTILCAGLTGTDTLTSLAIDILVHKQLRLQGARSKSSEAVVSALKLVESRKYPLEKMVSHRFPLERAEEAVKTAGGDIPGVYATKVVITP